MPHDGLYDFILPRVSYDRQNVNQYGKWLVDLCFDILNGRTLGDFCGKFACPIPRRSSVVDYFISSNTLSNEILSMNVHDISLFSDHCLIPMKLKICYDNETYESICKAQSNLKYTHLPETILWTEEAKINYHEDFYSSDFKNKTN